MDFQQIRENVPILEVVKLLGLELKPEGNGGTQRCKCPCGKGDHRSLAITPEKGKFFCFGEKEGGDCTGLYAHVKQVKMGEAAAALRKEFSLDSKPEKKEGFDPIAYQAKLLTEHELLDACGIEPADAKAWGIGVAPPKSTHAGRIVFPVYRDGKIDRFLAADEVHQPRKIK